MEEKNERHTYICAGISREAFQDIAVRATTEDPTLTYYVHEHKYSPYWDVPCNSMCTIIHGGKQKSVTQSDDSNQSARA